MADILHRVYIEVPPSQVYEALTRESGLAGWWTPEVEARDVLGSTAKFRFGQADLGNDMQITALEPGRQVAWRCTWGGDEWLGTELTFDLKPYKQGTLLLFAHKGWKDTTEHFAHCNTKWAFYLAVSLKQYLETGQGVPFPKDPKF